MGDGAAASGHEETHALQQSRADSNSLSGPQLVEQRLGLLQVARVEAFSEPAVDPSESILVAVPLSCASQPLNKLIEYESPFYALKDAVSEKCQTIIQFCGEP